MFAELYAVARHTALQISVSPEGERLNVLIVPKPGDDADEGSALTRPIQAIGTPEELDAELPAKLAEYCAAINDLRLKIDLPIEAISAQAQKSGAKKKAAAPAPRKPAPKPAKKSAPRPVKPVVKAPPVKATKSPASEPPARKSKRASREECLADLQRYLSEHDGQAPTRAAFIAWAASGRSYERKWKNWEAFIAEGTKAADDGVRIANPGEALPPVPDSAYAPGAVPLEDAQHAPNADEAPAARETMVKTALNPAARWPFPDAQKPIEATKLTAPADGDSTASFFPE